MVNIFLTQLLQVKDRIHKCQIQDFFIKKNGKQITNKQNKQQQKLYKHQHDEI